MRANLRIGIAIFVASVAFQSSFITLDAFVSDEGIVLVAADDVANGRLLFRDVNIPLTPTVYLLQGLAFEVFGSHFLVSRALICIVNAACAAMVFQLALTFLPTRRAVVAGLLAIGLQVWMWPHAHYFSYNQLTILLCLVALRAAWALETKGTRRSAFVLGVTLAAGLWTKPNLPVAIGAGVLVYWLSCWLRSVAGWSCPRPRTFGQLFGEGLATLAGIACASVPMVVYLAATGILDDMIGGVAAITQVYSDSPTGLFPDLLPLTEQLDAVRLSTGLVLPGMLINVFHGIGRDPFYHHLVLFTGMVDLFVRLLYYLPLMLYGTTALVLARRLRSGSWSRESEAAWLVLCGALLLYTTNISFPSFHYITPTLLPLVPLAVFSAQELRAPTHGRWRAGLVRWAGRGLTALYVVLSFVAVASYLSVPRSPVHTERGTLWVSTPTAVLWNEILEHTNRVMKPDDEIFAVPYFPLFYFMSGRDHPSRFVALGPGLPGMEAEDEIIGLLEHERVAYALNVYGAEYPGLEKFENAYPRLHHYLETRYELEHRFVGASRDYADLLRRRP
ncbi:MAG: hypothetical protein GY733_18735 [bacterium]|nr:hypothetical protein [bacterium]